MPSQFKMQGEPFVDRIALLVVLIGVSSCLGMDGRPAITANALSWTIPSREADGTSRGDQGILMEESCGFSDVSFRWEVCRRLKCSPGWPDWSMG